MGDELPIKIKYEDLTKYIKFFTEHGFNEEVKFIPQGAYYYIRGNKKAIVYEDKEYSGTNYIGEFLSDIVKDKRFPKETKDEFVSALIFIVKEHNLFGFKGATREPQRDKSQDSKSDKRKTT